MLAENELISLGKWAELHDFEPRPAFMDEYGLLHMSDEDWGECYNDWMFS